VFVRGMLTTLIVVASNQLLGLGDGGVGPLTAAIGLGGFIGALGALGLTRIARIATTALVALAFWGLPIGVMGAWPLVPIALAAMVVTGVSNAVLDVCAFTILQRGISTRDRMAVFGLLEGVVGFGMAIGGVAGSLAVEAFGPQGALGIAGAILPIMAVATWPWVTRIDGRKLVAEREAAVLRTIPLFAPLPLTAIDRLADARRTWRSRVAPSRSRPTAGTSRRSDRVTGSARSRCYETCHGRRPPSRPRRSRAMSSLVAISSARWQVRRAHRRPAPRSRRDWHAQRREGIRPAPSGRQLGPTRPFLERTLSDRLVARSHSFLDLASRLDSWTNHHGRSGVSA